MEKTIISAKNTVIERVPQANSSDNILVTSIPMLSPPKLKKGVSVAQLEIESEFSVEYIGGMFGRGKLSALVGESGKGKSWVLTAAMLTILSNKEFLPIDNYELRSNGRVLIVETEGRMSIYTQRFLDLDGDLENFIIPTRDRRILSYKSAEDRKLIESVIEEDKPDLVIFDSLAGFSDADENTCSVMPCIKWMNNLAQVYNIAVVFTQLANKSELKDGKLTTKSIRGFSGIGQMAEAIWAIDTPDNGDDKKKRLYLIKNNALQLDKTDYIFLLDNSTITFTGEVIETRKNKCSKRREILEANPDKSPYEIAKLIQEKLEPDAKLNTLVKWATNQK